VLEAAGRAPGHRRVSHRRSGVFRRDGGWFPLLIGLAVFLLFETWQRGRELVAKKRRLGRLTIELFLADPMLKTTRRVPGTAIFMTGDLDRIPIALLHNLKHNRVLHSRIVMLTVVTDEVPHVAPANRIELQDLGQGFHRVTAHYGFMEDPSVADILGLADVAGLKTILSETTFFLGSETLVPAPKSEMGSVRRAVFGFLSRNAQKATAFFRIPPNRVIEIGEQVEI
jgi:KUP system potassium uptake protein